MLSIDPTTAELIEELKDHQAAKPSAPEDYLANITHLQIQADRWQAHDNALRVVIGERLTRMAMEAV